jgi:hypothetical protein
MDKKSIQIGFLLHLNLIFDFVIFWDNFVSLKCNCLIFEIISNFYNTMLVQKGNNSINISHMSIGDVQIPLISITKAL